MPDSLLVDEPAPADLVSSEVVFGGAVWDIRREEFRYNDGTIRREYMDHTGAVAVLAVDAEERVLVIRQYRHPIRSRDWEIPAGLLDIVGEDPLLAAQRELAEEADLRADDWALLAEFNTTPGGSNEALRVYLARGLHQTEAFERTDEEADIEKRWVSLDELVDAVRNRRVRNSILQIAALQAHLSRLDGWSGLGDANEQWDWHPRLRG